MAKKERQVKKEKLSPRPAIVVVLGHVDHGKSTLLDYIRKTNLVATEPGGITQSIGAYQAQVITQDGKRLITFIDTPGHEAFASMRSRGAKVADLAVLVVAADDGVMPQTIEAIDHIRAAHLPMIIAINKIDLPQANIKRVIRQLAKVNVLVEGYGGDVVVAPISAKTGQGVDDELLEMIVLVSDLVGIKGDQNAPLSAVVIESRLDRRRGPVASIIVRNGSLYLGQTISAERVRGKVRNMFDEYGQTVAVALPGKPVEIIGWDDLPPVGAIVTAGLPKETFTSYSLTGPTDKKDGLLKLVVKADTIGSLEAVKSALPQDVAIVSSRVGDVTSSDVLLAKTTGSVILGFKVRIIPQAARLAKLEGVVVKTQELIYALVEEVAQVVEGLKTGGLKETLGQAQILATFTVGGMPVAGTKVVQGRLARGDSIKLIRAGKEVTQAVIKSLKIGKLDVNRVESSKECGVGFTRPLDFAVADAIISYRDKI